MSGCHIGFKVHAIHEALFTKIKVKAIFALIDIAGNY